MRYIEQLYKHSSEIILVSFQFIHLFHLHSISKLIQARYLHPVPPVLHLQPCILLACWIIEFFKKICIYICSAETFGTYLHSIFWIFLSPLLLIVFVCVSLSVSQCSVLLFIFLVNSVYILWVKRKKIGKFLMKPFEGEKISIKKTPKTHIIW